MTASPFASLEARLNGAIERRLANAQGVYLGGDPFPVLYGRSPDTPLGFVDAAQITLGFLLSRTPGLVTGSEIQVDGVAHVVSSEVQPDPSGWVSVQVYVKGA